jgi:hypothetical protein
MIWIFCAEAVLENGNIHPNDRMMIPVTNNMFFIFFSLG